MVDNKFTGRLKWNHMIQAYASNANGAGFSLSEEVGLCYKAELYVKELPTETVTAEDFIGAPWKLYKVEPSLNDGLLTQLDSMNYTKVADDALNAFANAAGSANLNIVTAGVEVPCLAMAQNEPAGFPLVTIPDMERMVFDALFVPAANKLWDGQTVEFFTQWKICRNGIWSTVEDRTLGEVTLPEAVDFVGDTTDGSAEIANIADTSILTAGQLFTGNGIPAGTTILSIDDANTITASANATATAAAVDCKMASVVGQCQAFTLDIAASVFEFLPGDVVAFTIQFTDNSTWSDEILLQYARIYGSA